MRGACVFYAGMLLILAGAVSVVHPLRFLRHDRRSAAIVAAIGCAVAICGLAFPESETTVSVARGALDQFLPTYQFHEQHTLHVNAPRERVYAAIKSVSAGEIHGFRALTWIRRFGRPLPPGILNAPEHQPILEVATSTSFLLLADEPGRELVLGTAVAAPPGWSPAKRPTPEDFEAARNITGFALGAVNFTVEDDGPNASLVTTETRVYATDPAVQRRFGTYWHVIYPGSAFLRRMWLLAIRRRAELRTTTAAASPPS
jgi:hypothetical protein